MGDRNLERDTTGSLVSEGSWYLEIHVVSEKKAFQSAGRLWDARPDGSGIKRWEGGEEATDDARSRMPHKTLQTVGPPPNRYQHHPSRAQRQQKPPTNGSKSSRSRGVSETDLILLNINEPESFRIPAETDCGGAETDRDRNTANTGQREPSRKRKIAA